MSLRRTLMILLILAIFASAWQVQHAHADACPHAPAPLLADGDEAVVAEGLGVLNVRMLPAVETGIAAQLYGGARVTVIGTPSCNGAYTWLRVRLSNGRSGWIAQGDWEAYWLLPVDVDADAIPTPFEQSCVIAFTPRHCA